MTTIFKVPSYYYGSTDFLDPAKVNNDIKALAQTTYTSGDAVQQNLKSTKSVYNNTLAYINFIKKNNTFTNGLNNDSANNVASSTSNSLQNLVFNNGNTYQSAKKVNYNVSQVINSIINQGQTNTFYNPADVVLNSTLKTIKKILNLNNQTINNSANKIFEKTNIDLDSIISDSNNNHSESDSTKIFNLTNNKIDQLIYSSKPFKHDVNYAGKIFNLVNKSIEWLFG